MRSTAEEVDADATTFLNRKLTDLEETLAAIKARIGDSGKQEL
jgi:hypothetical protein